MFFPFSSPPSMSACQKHRHLSGAGQHRPPPPRSQSSSGCTDQGRLLQKTLRGPLSLPGVVMALCSVPRGCVLLTSHCTGSLAKAGPGLLQGPAGSSTQSPPETFPKGSCWGCPEHSQETRSGTPHFHQQRRKGAKELCSKYFLKQKTPAERS